MSGGEAREDRAEGARGEFGVGRGGGGAGACQLHRGLHLQQPWCVRRTKVWPRGVQSQDPCIQPWLYLFASYVSGTSYITSVCLSFLVCGV